MGVFIDNGAVKNTISGTVNGPRKVIAFNNGGVIVTGDSGNGNAMLSNSIFSNGGVGIDLTSGIGSSGHGMTPNDSGDGDICAVITPRMSFGDRLDSRWHAAFVEDRC